MKISIAQLKPVNGDLQQNLDSHCRLIELAVSRQADLIIFPELSITGYEPVRAVELATSQEDPRFDVFQHISDSRNLTIGIGVPIQSHAGVCISLLLFHPQQTRQVYSKMHLHSSEEPWFTPGPATTGLVRNNSHIALAICYELSVPEHAANASANGAEIYLASVAEPVELMDKSGNRLRGIAREYSMTVLMANCIGESENHHWGGRSAVWNNQGVLLAQLDDSSEGIIVFDTETQAAETITPD